MTEADIAAFDIAFWLHHNNIDRIYEKYLRLPEGKNSKDEFEKKQQREVRDGKSPENIDWYKNSLTPFKKKRYWFDTWISLPRILSNNMQ
eukprot:535580_1